MKALTPTAFVAVFGVCAAVFLAVLWQLSARTYMDLAVANRLCAEDIVRHQVTARKVSIFATRPPRGGQGYRSHAIGDFALSIVAVPELEKLRDPTVGAYHHHHNAIVLEWSLFVAKSDPRQGAQLLEALADADETIGIRAGKTHYSIRDVIRLVSKNRLSDPIIAAKARQWELGSGDRKQP